VENYLVREQQIRQGSLMQIRQCRYLSSPDIVTWCRETALQTWQKISQNMISRENYTIYSTPRTALDKTWMKHQISFGHIFKFQNFLLGFKVKFLDIWNSSE